MAKLLKQNHPPEANSSHDELEKALMSEEKSAEKSALPAGNSKPTLASASPAAQPAAQDNATPENEPENEGEAKEGNDDGDDSKTEKAWHEKIYSALSPIFYSALDFVTSYPKRIAIVLIGVPLLYQASIFAYYTYLLKSAEEHLARQSYAAAAEKLGQYLSRYTEEIERGMTLVRLYSRLGNYSDAENALAKFQKDSGGAIPAQRYEAFLGILALLQDNVTLAQEHAKKSLAAAPDYLPGYYVQAAVHFYGERDMNAVILSMEQGTEWFDEKSEDAPQNREDIHFFREVLHSTRPSIVSENLPLPFESLTEVHSPQEKNNNTLSRLPVSGFYHLYYVPTEQKVLLEENIATLENIRLFQAVAALHLDDLSEADKYLALAKGGANAPSLYQRYIEGFIAAKKGDYEQSAAIYRALIESRSGFDANIMLASSLWAMNNGAAPTQEMISLYDVATQSGSALATANLGYLNIYLGQLQEARRLLEGGVLLAPEDFYLTYNLAFLNAMENDFAAAIDLLRTMRNVFPDTLSDAGSLKAGRLLAQALFLQGEYQQAIDELNSMKESHDVPVLYLEIAKIHKAQSELLLAASALSEGLKAFPENDDIRIELLLEYARQKDVKRYEEIRSSTGIRILKNNHRALLAEGIIREKSPTKAKPHFLDALAAAQSEEHKEEVLIAWARALMVNGHYQQAKDILDPQTNATSTPSLKILRVWAEAINADESRKKALIDEAAQLKDRALAGPAQTQIDLSHALIELGEYEQAEKQLLALKGVNKDTRVLIGLEKIYSASGDERELQRIRNLLDLRRHADAKSEAQQSAKYREAAAKVKDTGLTFSDTGQTGVGLSGQLAVAAGGRESVVQLNDALAKKDYQTAVNIYSDFIRKKEIHPPFTPAIMHQNRGVLYLKMENYEAAAEDFEKALEFEDVKPEDHISMLYNYSLALIKTEQFEKSSSILKKMLEKDPSNLRGWVLYSQVLKKLREFKQLVSVYSKILELSPGQVSIYLELAGVYRIEGNIPKAIETLNDALDISQRSKAIHRALAELYTINLQADKAQKHLDIIKGL